MHEYTTQESRLPVYGALAIPAIAAAWLISWATSSLSWPQWVVSAPSVLTMYLLAYSLFDRYGWDTRIARLTGLTRIANVSGVYEGFLISNYEQPDGTKVRVPVRFEITQTWSRIDIYMKVTTGSSTSQSQSAVTSVAANPNVNRIRYIYTNKVNPAIADNDMGDHDGAAELLIRKDGSLTGTYFNGRPRKGSIEATRLFV